MDDDKSRWVELRVHGVSGTPPGSMLDRPHVEQVGGDDESRYFRSVGAAGEQLYGGDGQVLEAYHWGRLTSGSRFNALWLFLLPFGMVNAAHYMLPAPTRGMPQLVVHATCDALLRFLGVLLTSMYAFAGGLVFIDLIGWRWAASKTGLLATVGSHGVLTVAVLLSAGLVLLLAFLGRGYRDTPAAAPATGTASSTRVALPSEAQEQGTPLAHPAFYSGDSRAGQLKQLHVATGLLVVAMMAVLVVEPDGWRLPWADEGGSRRFWTAAVIWAAVAALVLFFGDPERGTRTWSEADKPPLGRGWSALTRVAAPGLLLASVLAVGLAVRKVWSVPVSHTGQERPASFDIIANYLLVLGVVTLGLLLVVNLVLAGTAGLLRNQPRNTPGWHFRPYAYGNAAAMLALTGTFFGVGIAAAVTTGVSSLLRLSDPAGSADGQKVSVGTTPMLDRVAYSWGLNAIFLFALVVLGVLVSRWPSKKRERDRRVTALYGGTEDGVLTRRWRRKVARALRVAELKYYLGHFFVIFATVGLFVSAVVAYELWGCRNGGVACHQAGWFSWLSQPKRTVGDDGTPLTNIIGLVGAWLVLAAAGLLLLQSRKALKAEEKRRTLNVVWDVLSFWPQATHPFAPRPYSKRCVEDVQARIRHLLQDRDPADDQPRDLVLCGHSQGSLISFAALLGLEREHRDRVGFVTFGSQLQVMFPRGFPAYVNYRAIKWLYDELGGAWINLYRLTDPLAGPVLSWGHRGDATGKAISGHFPAVGTWSSGWEPEDAEDGFEGEHRTLRCGADWQLADPVPADRGLQAGAVAEILGHSWYARNHDWRTCLGAVRSVAPPDRETPEAGEPGQAETAGAASR